MEGEEEAAGRGGGIREGLGVDAAVCGPVRAAAVVAHLCGRPVCMSLLQGGLSVGEMEVSVTLLQGRPKASF